MEKDTPQYATIRSHYLFSGLTDSEFDVLATEVTVESHDKGEILFHRGDNADAFFFVESGQIELSLISRDGQKKIIEVIANGRTFAEAILFMPESKFPVSAEALSNSVVYRIPNDAYRSLLVDNSDACIRLLGDVCYHLHQRVREIERLTIQNARSRLASYLIDHVVETDDDEATVRLDLPRHVVASRLSITPETLSRLLRAMSDDGILTVDDRLVFVHSLARLRPYD
ncbi:MAG: Crp/Fnr family transcriptional regulator [Gammaproteobacteria bacterium]|nr:Crp/Fnr family transcriptional regulator [Gammaproteobacteria bacterium]NNL50304.1 Crp/Fnr family transcriptional regulator [Woeseiaceae bacterium]